MKILKVVEGFTTNSSGSYEWLPEGVYYVTDTPPASTPTTSTTSINTTSTPTASSTQLVAQPKDNPANQTLFVPKTAGGIIIFLLSLATGAIAAAAIFKELKNKGGKDKQK